MKERHIKSLILMFKKSGFIMIKGCTLGSIISESI